MKNNSHKHTKAQKVDSSARQSNSALAESNQINGARKACNLESVQGAWGVKGGIRGDASQVAPLSPLEKTLSQAKLESSNNAQRVDSSMDCHALPSDKARNDDKKVDSSMKNEKAENVFDTTPQDSRICDEKPLLCEPRKEIRLERLSTQRGEAIKGLSRKAESLKPVIFIFAIVLIISIAKNVDLWLKYNRLQDVYIDTLARHTGWERDYILEAMKYSLDKVKPNIKEQRESGQIDLFPYKERSLNKEFENLNKEIEKDIEHKLDKIELGGGVNE